MCPRDGVASSWWGAPAGAALLFGGLPIGTLLLGTLLLGVPAVAEAQYFGRNQVQYRTFDVQVIRTRHFDIYYDEHKRAAALDAARMIERSYARLSRVLQHEFRDRKPVILYASHAEFQQTNALGGLPLDESTGGVTESFKQRIIMPFTGTYAEFEQVLTHELVHQFQYDVLLRRGLGDASPFMVRLPLWFMEGMAEYLSIGHVDAHTESWLRDAVLAGYLRTIDEMTQRDDYLSYRFGQSLWAYIGGRWGDDVAGVLLQRASRMGLDEAFAVTLGITLDELSRQWTTQVRRTYLPDVATTDPPDAFAQRLTAHDAVADPWYLGPAISPDGRWMVYISQRAGFSFDLWLADARTGAVERRLVTAARNANFESLRFMSSGAAFSPDGQYLAFAAQTGGRDALYIYDVQRDRVARRLHFELSGIAAPSWSPDGRRIVFTGLDAGRSDLFITDLDGRLQRLTDDRHAALLPAWSPDGRRIAFTTDRGPATDFELLAYGNYRVAIYDLDRRTIDVLPQQDDGRNSNPVWSPDGSQLIWVSDRTGTNNLYLYELATAELHQLTDVLSGTIAVTPLSPVLAWSRSDRLLFTYFERAGYNIYAVDAPRTLPRTPVSPPAPALARGDVGDGDGDGDGGAGAARRTSVMELLESAARALPDTADFELAPYRVRFSADVVGQPTIGAQVGGHYGAGLYGGSFIALSDMLGDHSLVFAGGVNGSLADASFLGAYSYLRHRANVSVAVLQQPFYRYLGAANFPLVVDGAAHDVAAHVFQRDVIRGAQARVNYPFSAFQRVEVGVSGVHYQRDVLYRGYYRSNGAALEIDRRDGTLRYLQPMAALVFDNALFGWTGPVAGRRYRIQLARPIGGMSYNEALVDVRNYVNYRRDFVFATRLLTLARLGGNPDRFRSYWGGPYYLRGYGGGSFGYDDGDCHAGGPGAGASLSPCPARDQLIGSSAALVNAEVRFPVVSELQLGPLGSFPPVDGVFFADGGIAWDRTVCGTEDFAAAGGCAGGDERRVRLVRQRRAGQDPYLYRMPLFSYGVGVRINVFYTVLRIDYAFPLNRPGYDGRRGLLSLAFGPSF